jgi:hypothetical protein
MQKSGLLLDTYPRKTGFYNFTENEIQLEISWHQGARVFFQQFPAW